MMNKNERMEMLKKAGINTNKYFSVDLENGTKIHLIIDENGNAQVVDNHVKNDPIYNDIIEDGYVRNTKLHRRWVMAQMFNMLNYKSYDGKYSGYTDCLKNRYGYDYTLTMMLEEIRVLSKLEVRDRESFIERSNFFTKDVVIDVLYDYLENLKKYIDSLSTKNCKGIPYKKVKGVNVFVDDLDKKIYMPIKFKISDVKRARNYTEMYRALANVMKNMIKLPWQTPKSKAWIDAYKGEGSFYTCKNLIMFNNCNVMEYDVYYDTKDSMKILNNKLDEYQGEGWRMFAFMKKLIADNNFDFYKKMREVYGGEGN